MDDRCSGEIADSAYGTFGYSILVLSTNARETDRLGESLHVVSDGLTFHNPIVRTKLTDFKAEINGFSIQISFASKSFGRIQ